MSDTIIHYPELFDRSHAIEAMGVEEFERDERYRAIGGRRYGYRQAHTRGVMEIVELYPDVLLLTDHCVRFPPTEMRQLIGEGRWTHLQFWLNGSGQESLSGETPLVQAPEASCVAVAYARGTLIKRRSPGSAVQKTACLYMRSSMMTDYFGASVETVPEHLRWIIEGVTDAPRFHTMPLHAGARAAVNDMLACSFSAQSRRLYLQAKSMELVAVLLESIARQSERNPQPRALTTRDIRNIRAAREIIHARPCEPLTLEALAASVGLNRSKLASGFKEVYGTTVQAYWRELRLSLARDLLRSEDIPVTEVAARLGYSEISAFTRAFTLHFGTSPSELRSNAAAADLAVHQRTVAVDTPIDVDRKSLSFDKP